MWQGPFKYIFQCYNETAVLRYTGVTGIHWSNEIAKKRRIPQIMVLGFKCKIFTMWESRLLINGKKLALIKSSLFGGLTSWKIEIETSTLCRNWKVGYKYIIETTLIKFDKFQFQFLCVKWFNCGLAEPWPLHRLCCFCKFPYLTKRNFY